MDSKVYDILGKYNVSLDLTSETKLLESIKELNSRNQDINNRNNGMLVSSRNEISRLLEESATAVNAYKEKYGELPNGMELLSDLIDVDKLNDTEYKTEVVEKIVLSLKRDKEAFSTISSRALNELGGSK